MLNSRRSTGARGWKGTDGRAVTDAIEAAYPDVEIEIADGGQAHYDYIISLE